MDQVFDVDKFVRKFNFSPKVTQINLELLSFLLIYFFTLFDICLALIVGLLNFVIEEIPCPFVILGKINSLPNFKAIEQQSINLDK